MADPSEYYSELLLLVGRIDANISAAMSHIKDHDGRLERLEKDRVRLGGAVAGLAAAVSWFFHDKISSVVALFH